MKYGNTEADNEEWERLWNDLDEVLERDCVMKYDLNGLVRDVKSDITSI